MTDEIDGVQCAALDRPDAREGAAALLEERAPVFARLGDGSTASSDQGGPA